MTYKTETVKCPHCDYMVAERFEIPTCNDGMLRQHGLAPQVVHCGEKHSAGNMSKRGCGRYFAVYVRLEVKLTTSIIQAEGVV